MRRTGRLAMILALCSPIAWWAAAGTGRQQSAHIESGATFQSFTLQEAKTYHRRFEEPLANWGGGGDFTRYVFLHMTEFWRHAVISRSGAPRTLTVDYKNAIADFRVAAGGEEMTLQDYVRNSPTDGVIMVHEDRILFEDYPRMAPTDVHVWFSVSKTFVSTAVAILEDRGQIDTDETIDVYIEELGGTAWDGIPIVDILDMTSGINCPEVHDQRPSCFWNFYDAFGWPITARVQDEPRVTFLEMERLRPSGEVFDYTSVNTELLTWLVETVAGERFVDFIEREIWQKTGSEGDALIATTPNGGAFSAGGVSTTLRDLARYGILFTAWGRSDGTPTISNSYLRSIQESGRAELTSAAAPIRALLGGDFRHNSYQWDVVTVDGDFFKGGLGGQGLYVSPSRNLVIAWFGTLTEEGEQSRMLPIARQLVKSGLRGY